MENGFKSASLKRQRSKQHEATIKEVLRVLDKHGIFYQLADRSALKTKPRVDLIITVGGDGTVIAAAHVADKLPILGVNSMPGVSIGHFCSANAKTFEKILTRIIEKKQKPKQLPLLQGTIDDRPLSMLALNDILFANSSPAESVYYSIRNGKNREFQRGSGIWISAGPGSTAGYCSAGGKPSALTSATIRYLVREACPLPRKKYRMLKGAVQKGKEIAITCEGQGCTVYLDGTSLKKEMRAGQTLKVGVAKHALSLYA